MWIKVSERLPEYVAHAGGDEFAIVLVCVNGQVGEGMYSNGKWTFMSVDASPYVTHWQPLPPPPEEES